MYHNECSTYTQADNLVHPLVVLLAQRLPGEHERVAGRDPEAAHVQAVPQEVPLDPGPHRRRLLLQGLRCSAQTSFKHYVVLNIGCAQGR